MNQASKEFQVRNEITEDLMWDFIGDLGPQGKAAVYWAGRTKDDRPPGSDALWYDTAPFKNTMENKRYPGRVQEKHLYLTMSDGAEIAISVYLPNKVENIEKLPTLVNQTCYGRVHKIRPPYNKILTGAPYYIDYIVPRGYAYVMVDVRGTGASSGDRPANRTKSENDDAYEIAEWIISQPWSNGRIGLEGVSYMGVSSYMSLAVRHPAIVAAVPQFAFTDVYDEFTHPGGVFCERLVKMWSANVHQLVNAGEETGDWFSDLLSLGVMPVDEDKDSSKLKKVVAGHKINGDTYEMTKVASFRDSEIPGLKEQGFSFTHVENTPAYYIEDVEKSGAAIYSIGGWFDGAFLRGTVARFHIHNNNGKHKLVIGPWDHGAGQNISPWSPSRRPGSSRIFEMLRFFDFHLKEIDTGVYSEHPVHYFTMGEEKWKASAEWPPAESQNTAFYFSENNKLTKIFPNADIDKDMVFDEYQVDFSASSGMYNRWHTICNLGDAENPAVDIGYPKRNEQQACLLTYTTPTLAENMEVTGHPVVNIQMACTTPDCAVFVYLEDVGPEGDVVYVTEGVLRASRRKLSEPPYPMLVPYHSHLKNDSADIEQGEIVELVIEMLPTSYQFKKGRSIRISIAGADSETFERVPAGDAIPVFTIYRNSINPSHINLPIMANSK
ncbi:MAG: CocE/NonD family hydrolase [Thermodesulfobacteriota bacterium]